MKELSIEEKARRYDEAIEIAKKWRNAPNVDKIPTFANRVIDEIFSELKESEDERIRKELIDYFSASHATDTFRGIPWDRVVAWLEKQGEQKSIDSLTQQKAMDIAVAKCFEQGEQKPQRMVSAETKEAMYDKPAWSEEDKVKDNWELIHEFINKFGRIPKDEDELNVLIEYVLKRQKPAWSEEDEEMRLDAIKYLELFDAQGIHGDAAVPCINWLKSLKERYTWKPSKEQIVALRWVLNNIPYNKHKEEISGLLDQIKGL